MKTKTMYPIANSLKDAKVIGQTYSTTNFKMFKTLRFNRGRDNGIEPRRLKDFVKLYESNGYFMGVIHVFINRMGVLIDGHHKLELHKLIKEPVNFVVLGEDEFNNGTEVEILSAIARFNAKTSKWDGMAHFNTAVQCNEPFAMAIAKVKAKYDKQYGFKKNLLTPSRIHALITEERKGLSSQSNLNVSDYCKTELLPLINADKFKEEFEFVTAVMKYAVDWNKQYKDRGDVTPFYIIRHVMPKVWDNELNMKKFYHCMVKKGLSNVSNTMSGVGTWVDDVATMSRKTAKKDEVLISW